MAREVDNTKPRFIPPGACSWCGHAEHDFACASNIRTKASDSTPCPCRSIVQRGVDQGHCVTVSALGPAWVTECSCGMASVRRASKHQGNLVGLAHLRLVLVGERSAS